MYGEGACFPEFSAKEHPPLVLQNVTSDQIVPDVFAMP